MSNLDSIEVLTEQIKPTPTSTEAAVIVAAITQAWPKAPEATKQPVPQWRFANRRWLR